MFTMNGWWVVSAIVLLLLVVFLGAKVRGQALGILVDNRGRFSLAQFQMVTWTIVVLSLITAVFAARLVGSSPATALGFTIPRTLLLVMGISLGSLAGAAAIKGTKDQARPTLIAASDDQDRPRWWQMFTLEEGTLADKAVDIGKFQNFWLTLTLVIGYIAMTVSWLSNKTPDAITTLPDFPDSMITLLLVSHAGYLANKLPNREGEPQGLTVAKRDKGFSAMRVGQEKLEDKQYIPRNPAPK